MSHNIRNLQEVSKDIAKTINDRGGLYDNSTINNSFHNHLFNNAVKHFEHLTKLATERYYYGSSRVLKFGIINTANIGGFACVGKEDIDFIGIHFGTISLISAIFTRMLSNSNILPDIGKSSLETNAGQAYFVPTQEDMTNFSPCRPTCRIRDTFSKHLTLTGLDFIFGHEIAHVTKGHFGIINKTMHEDPEKRRPKLSPLENQAIELDADLGATEWTLLYSEFVRNSRSSLPVEDNDALGISWREFYITELDTLRYCFIASYITLRMSDPTSWTPDYQLNIRQPLPPYRMGSLMNVYVSVLTEYHAQSFDKAQSQIHAWCIESEKAFADLLSESGKGELQLSAIESFFKEVGNYHDKVNNAYKKLANELNTYAMKETTLVVHPRPRVCGYTVLKGLQQGIEFTGILEARRSLTYPKGLELQCFIQGNDGIYRLPFPLWFTAEFEGDMLKEALTTDGVNWVASVEGVKSFERAELSSILDKTELLRFSLLNSKCPKLKADLIQLLHD